jgi:hypothetical protein
VRNNHTAIDLAVWNELPTIQLVENNNNMTNIDLELAMAGGRAVTVSHQFRNEMGFDADEVFNIVDIIGNYELCIIENQYGQRYKTNPNNLSE